MPENISMIIAAAPSESDQVREYRAVCAHLAYRVGDGLELLRAAIRSSMRGGLMALSDKGLVSPDGDPGALAQEVIGECVRRGYTGVIADFQRPDLPALHEFIRLLSAQSSHYRLTLYTGAAYTADAPDCGIVLPCCVTGGRLREYLESLTAQYESSRICLDLTRLCHDSALFNPGEGYVPISLDKLREYIKQCHPIKFFSPELYANYFTCRDKEGGVHFIVYDDGYSLSKKLALAQTHGIGSALLLYSETADVLEDLFSRVNPTA